MSSSLTYRLRTRPVGLHGDHGDESWGLAWAALEWLEANVQPGWHTLETGSGHSTIVIASRGAVHAAVTPDPGEESRFRAACAELAVPTDAVTFHIGPSHVVLPALPATPLDLVLIDGAHGLPYPVIDWWSVASRVRIGGVVLLDDAYMPPVAAITDGLRGDPAWEIETTAGYRTVIQRKRAETLPHFDWDGRAVGGRMSFRYLPLGPRVVASARHRFFSTRLGLRIVALVRRNAGFRWRKTG